MGVECDPLVTCGIIVQDAGLYCGPRLRKGEVFAYVGLPQNLKDLKASMNKAASCPLALYLFAPPPPLLLTIIWVSGLYRGTSLIRNISPPKITTGPKAQGHSRDLL